MSLRRTLLAPVLFAFACGGAIPGKSPIVTTGTSSSDLPTVPTQGGPTIGAIRLVTVSYAGSRLEGAITSFGDYVVGSQWLDDVGAEYGVTLGTHAHVNLTDAPPASVNAQSIGVLLAKEIEAGVLPKPDAHTVYMYYPDPSTTITDDDPDATCAAFEGTYSPGYHYEGAVNGKRFAFGVVPTCDALLVSTLEMVTSHEMIEAATDPYLVTAPGYIFPETSAWWQTGGEVADICDAPATVEGHTVTRVWSNAAAQAGTNPCVPAVTPFTTVKAPTPVMLPVGSSTSFQITGWALESADAWWVYAMPGVYGGTNLAPDIDVAKIEDGKVAHVQITAPTGAKSGDSVDLLVYSESEDRTTHFVQPVTVTFE